LEAIDSFQIEIPTFPITNRDGSRMSREVRDGPSLEAFSHRGGLMRPRNRIASFLVPGPPISELHPDFAGLIHGL